MFDIKKRLKKLNSKIIRNVNSKGCWYWTGFHKPKGYAQIKWNGKTYSLHKLMFILFKGSIPKHLVCRHTCNNTRCVNPDHIILGTHLDNANDAKRFELEDKMRQEFDDIFD